MRIRIKTIKKFFIFLLIASWIFSGWPHIFNVPPKIQEANASVPLPQYRASGAFAASTGSITPAYPASMAAGDVCLLVVTSENEAISLTTANGFVEVPTWSPQSAGTAATDPASRMAVFWKRTVGGDSAPVVADSGNNNEGVIHCFSGVISSGNPWDTGAGGNDSAQNDTAGNIPGSTTTVDNTLVVLMESTSFNGNSAAECSGWTNANLANITERQDNSNTAGLGGGSCMATGEKATAGAYTTTTVTMANTTFKGAVSLALRPEPQIISGTIYSDEGATPISVSKTVKLALGTNPVVVYSTTTCATCGGFWGFSNIGAFGLGTPMFAWVDGDANFIAAAMTKASSTSNSIATSSASNNLGLNLYQNRFIVRHEGFLATSTTIADLAQYDADNAASLPYLANGGTLTVAASTTLYVWPGTEFAPGGAVTVAGSANNSSLPAIDGTVKLAVGLRQDKVGTSSILTLGSNNLTLAGSFFASSTSILSNSGTITFNATTTGRSIVATSSALGNVTFNGIGGAWLFGAQASATNLTITNGTVTAPSLLSVDGNYSNNSGTFTAGAGTMYFSGSSAQTIAGATSTSAFNNVILSGTGGVSFASGNNGSTTDLTINSGETLTAPTQMTIGGNYTNSGTVNGSPTTLYFNGSSAQTVIGATTTAFAGANWILNGTGGVSFASGNNGSTSALTINSGETLTAPSLLTVTGNFSNSGSFTNNNGTLYLSGSSKTFTSGGNTFNNVNVLSGASVTLLDQLTLASNLSLNGAFATQGNTVRFTGGTLTNSIGAVLQSLWVFSGTVTIQSDTTVSTSTITSGAILSVASGVTLTSTSTMTLLGTLTSASQGNGTTTFGNASFVCSNVPSTGTISGNVRFNATAGNCTIPARTYGANAEPYSNSSVAARSVTMAGATTISGNLLVNAANTQNITFDGATNNPVVTLTGDMAYIGSGTGSKIITSGSGNWKVSGNANFTNGTYTAASGNSLIMDGSSKTLTLAGNNLVNFNASSSITISGNATTTGNFLIGSAGTLTAPGSTASLYIGGNFKNDYGGTFTNNSGIIFFNGSSAQTIAGATSTSAFNNVILSGTGGVSFASGNNASTSSLTINSGETLTAPTQMTISGNYTNSGTVNGSPTTLYFNGSSAQTVIGATTTAFAGANWILNGTGGVSFASGNNGSTTNLTINSGETLTAPSLLTVSGNYTNNGTFTANSGTVYASSSAPQTFSGTMTGTTGAFYNLNLLNNSGTNPDTNPAIIFASNASTTATFTATLASTTIRFPASATSTFVNVTINGQAANSRVWLRSSTAGTPWGLIVTGTQSVSYANVQDSYACDGNTITATDGTNNDSGNNSCWNFTGTPATIVSAANQVFNTSQGSTAISQITVTAGTGSGAIKAADATGDLRIAIATSTVDMRWDSSVTTPTFGGTASGKVAATVTYEGGNSVMKIDVTPSDFANGDTLTISGGKFMSFGTAVASSTALQLFLDGPNDQTANAQNTAQYVAIKGTQTVADATAGQEQNKLANADPSITVTNASLFSFKLTPASESASTTQIVVSLSSITGYTCSNIANLNLYVDYNSNNSVDAGETATGTPTCSISGSTGTFTFDVKLATSTARNFVVLADISGNNFGNTMTVGLTAANVTTRGQTSNQPITPTGTVTSARHSQQSTSGGGASAAGSVSSGERPTFGATTQSGGGAAEGGQGGSGGSTGGGTGQGGGSPIPFVPSLLKPYAAIQLPWNFASALFGLGRLWGM